MFLIYNTVMFSVVQRRPVLGTMRALGLTGGQLFGLGLAGTAGGGGLGAGRGPAGRARAPALGAAPPRRWIPWVAGTGVALLGLGSLLLAWARSSILTSLLALAGVVVGLALMVPAATFVLRRMAGPVMRRAAGALGTMAARSVVRSLSRTGIAIAALTVSVSATIGVSAMITSFRSTVANWLDLVLRADVYVSAPGPSGAQWGTNLPPDLVARPESVEGVAGV